MERLGRLPRRGDVIEDQGWRLRVRSTEGRRGREVEITPVDGEARWGRLVGAADDVAEEEIRPPRPRRGRSHLRRRLWPGRRQSS